MTIFVPAKREHVPVKLALDGVSGAGKTYTALRLARGIAGPEGRIALVDSEHGSALEYADIFDFDHANMVTYHPDSYLYAIQAAVKDGYDVLILDGISQEWNGPGGVQEIVDKNTKGNNSWSGWAVGTPAHNKFLTGILSCPIHVIATMRSKDAWVVDERNNPKKIGLEPVQRSGIEYEFTICASLDLEHRLVVTKSRRLQIPVGAVYEEPNEDLGALILASGNGGVPKAEIPLPEAEALAPEPEAEQPAIAEARKVDLPEIARLSDLVEELATLRPDHDWSARISEVCTKDYQAETVNDLTLEDFEKLFERLQNTKVELENRAAAPA